MKNIVKWMKPRLLVQFITAIQMTILSESSLAILKSKMAIFRLKYQKAIKMVILA